MCLQVDGMVNRIKLDSKTTKEPCFEDLRLPLNLHFFFLIKKTKNLKVGGPAFPIHGPVR